MRASVGSALSPFVAGLCDAIEAGQSTEIAAMTDWLAAKGLTAGTSCGPSPPPPLPPLSPGGAVASAVTFSATVSGDAATFDRTAYAANLALLAGVTRDAVSLTIASDRRALSAAAAAAPLAAVASLLRGRRLATFTVIAQIIAASSTLAQAISTSIGSLTPQQASDALGVAVTAIALPAIATVTVYPPPAPSPELPLELADANQEAASDGGAARADRGGSA